MLSETLPSADIRNIYISPSKAKNAIKRINQLDDKIADGFILNKKCKSKKWNKFEVLRLYDWGQIHCRWSSDKKNKDVQRKLKKLLLELDKLIKKSEQNIFEMTLNYHSEDPEKYTCENLLELWEEQNDNK